jgi:Tfp pilus assembly protein PilO
MKNYVRFLDVILFWSPGQRWLFTGLVSFCLFGGWYFFCYQSFAKKIAVYTQEYKTAVQEAALAVTIEKNKTELMQTIEQLKTQLPPAYDENFSFDQLLKKIQSCDLVLEKFTMAGEQTRNDQTLFPFECTMVGDYFALQKFLTDSAQIAVIASDSCVLTKKDDKTIVCHYKGSLIS